MFNQPKYDFSRESKIKNVLLEKCLIKVRKAKDDAFRDITDITDITPLADDELEMVTAAVGLSQSNKCPLDIKCAACHHYAPWDMQTNPNRCRYGYIKKT